MIQRESSAKQRQLRCKGLIAIQFTQTDGTLIFSNLFYRYSVYFVSFSHTQGAAAALPPPLPPLLLRFITTRACPSPPPPPRPQHRPSPPRRPTSVPAAACASRGARQTRTRAAIPSGRASQHSLHSPAQHSLYCPAQLEAVLSPVVAGCRRLLSVLPVVPEPTDKVLSIHDSQRCARS